MEENIEKFLERIKPYTDKIKTFFTNNIGNVDTQKDKLGTTQSAESKTGPSNKTGN